MDGSATLWANRGNDYGRERERFDATWGADAWDEEGLLSIGTYDYADQVDDEDDEA